MDLIIGFLGTFGQHDSIMVAMDMLKEVEHFIPMKSMYSASGCSTYLHQICSEATQCSKEDDVRQGC